MRMIALLKRCQERSLLHAVVAKNSATLTMACNADEWLALVRKREPGEPCILIIDDEACDPDLLLASVRGLEENPGSPYSDGRARPKETIIVISSMATRQDLRLLPHEPEFVELTQALFERGADLIMARPFSTLELKAAIDTALQYASNPPAWLQLIRLAKNLMRREDFMNACQCLMRLVDLRADDFRLSMLYAKCLVKIPGEDIEPVRDTFRRLLCRFPTSGQVRRSYVEFLRREWVDRRAALVAAVELCRLDMAEANLKILVELILNLDDQERTPEQWFSVMNVLMGPTIERTRSMRLTVLKSFLQKWSPCQTSEQFMRMLEFNVDILSSLQPELLGLVGRYQREIDGCYGEADRAFFEEPLLALVELILDKTDPSSGEALMVYTQIKLRQGDQSAVDVKLRRARALGRGSSFEYSVSAIRFALAKGDSMQASNYLNGLASRGLSPGQRDLFNSLFQECHDKAGSARKPA